MSTLELKNEIHKKVGALDNVAELFDINQTLNFYIFDDLTEHERLLIDRLNKTIIDHREGKGIPREIMAARAKSWLKR